MATSAIVPLREYLSTSYRPDCDWIDGEVKERNVGERQHASVQKFFIRYFGRREEELDILVVVLWGGFATNLVWSFIPILKNPSGGQFLRTPGLNPMRTAPLTGNTLAEFDPEDSNYSDRL